MKKNTIISGFVILAVGLIMYLIGRDALDKAQINYQISQLSQLLGQTPVNESAVIFWSIFTFIGLILLICGIIISILGTIIEEETSFSIFRSSKCFNCGANVKVGDKFCNNCGEEFEWN